MQFEEMTVTTLQLSEALGIGANQINKLAARGILPKAGHNRYPLKAAVRAYTDHMRQAPGTGTTIKQELDQERLDALRHKNAKQRGELLPVEVLQSYAEKLGSMIHDQLETLPGKIKKQIPHLRGSELSLIRRELAKARASIANFNPPHKPTV